MSLTLTLYDSPAKAVQIADYSYTTRGLTASTGPHGFEQLHADQLLPLDESFHLYDRPGLPWAILSDGAGVVWEGRLDAAAIRDGSATLGALGAWQWLTDLPYTALWSTTSVSDWRSFRSDESVSYIPERYEMDTNNRIMITPQKNATYSGSSIGGQIYFTPDRSTRGILGLSFDYEMIGPVGWQGRLLTYNGSYTATTVAWSLNATGALQTGSALPSFATNDRLSFDFLYNAVAAVFAGETGTAYLKITNIRIVTATTNIVSTTFTANRAAGVSVTATVGSTARMYAGQRLIVNNPNATSESVLVQSVTNSTQFVATFINSYTIGQAVQAFVIYADEIAKDCLASVVAVNTGLSSNTTLIQSPGIDLTDQSFADANMGEVLDSLTAIGDNSTPPLRWECGVSNQQLLYFRPKSSASRTWYVDIAPDGFNVERSLETLYNSIYVDYQDSDGRILRTAASSDAASITRYGLTKQLSVGANTTSSTLANTYRATSLQDGKDPPPRSTVAFDGLYDAGGAWWPLYWCRSGDTLIIRNLPPTLSTAIDRIRVLRLIQVEYDAGSDTDDESLKVVPEGMLPNLEFFLVRLSAGAKV